MLQEKETEITTHSRIMPAYPLHFEDPPRMRM